MTDEKPPEVPPDDLPDGGMRTASEDASAPDPTDPTAEDHGMAAGYPIIDDEAIPKSPGGPADELETPPPEAMTGTPLFSEGLDLDDPFAASGSKLPSQPGGPLPPDPEMVKLLVSDQDVIKLWKRADGAREDVNEDIASLLIARQMLDLLQSGQNEIMGGRDRFEESERFINEVEYRIYLIRLVKSWTKRYAVPIFVYLLVVGTLLLVILATALGGTAFSSGAQITADVSNSPPDIVYLFTTMVWAGFGGVLGALFALVRHVSQDQDFDKQHTMWYLGSPWVGGAVGAATYLLLRAGLLSLMSSSADIQSPIVIYVIALLAGYRHNVFTDLVRRILNTFQVATPVEETPPPDPHTPEKNNNQSETPAEGENA